MKYLDKVVNRLVQGITESLEHQNITEVEAAHVAALLIQVMIHDSHGFVNESSYAEIALKAIRREKGRYTDDDPNFF